MACSTTVAGFEELVAQPELGRIAAAGVDTVCRPAAKAVKAVKDAKPEIGIGKPGASDTGSGTEPAGRLGTAAAAPSQATSRTDRSTPPRKPQSLLSSPAGCPSSSRLPYRMTAI